MSDVAQSEGPACQQEQTVAESREALPPDGQEDEELDPRVQEELEKLNVASEDINRFEKELEGARTLFKQVTDEATVTLNTYKKGREKSIAKARPYFEMRRSARKAHVMAQAAAQAFENAFSRHKAAREMVSRAEVHVLAGRSSQIAAGVTVLGRDDLAWMEVLDDATIKVMTTEKERRRSEEVHMESSSRYSECERKVHGMFKKNKRSIKKAMPYFEQHAKYWLQLEKQKKRIVQLQGNVSDAKARYRSSLSSLERISNEIHESRLSRQMAREAIEGASSPESEPPGERTDGVGAEVNVDDVMESVTGMTLEYSESLESIDKLEDGEETPKSLFSRLEELERDETDSLTTAMSCDHIDAMSEAAVDSGAGSRCESAASCVLEGAEGTGRAASALADTGEHAMPDPVVVAVVGEDPGDDVKYSADGDSDAELPNGGPSHGSDQPQSLADELKFAEAS